MNPGRRIKCPDCGWWGGHSLSCPEMSKDVPRSGLREKDLFEWEDVDTSDPATMERLALGGSTSATDGIASGAYMSLLCPYSSTCPLHERPALLLE